MRKCSKEIGCVLVTFNRLEKLKKALSAYDVQTVLPSYVMVVNNCSTDGTEEYLSKWKEQESLYRRIVINMPENLGGAGGFYRGFQEGLKQSAEWIYVADDDAYPLEDAIEQLDNAILGIRELDNVMAVCTAVMENGKICIDHRRRAWIKRMTFKQMAVPEQEYRKTSFELQLFSYVGAVISKTGLRVAGLPRADYFIHYDDTEHSLRISKRGKILCIPAAKVIHDSQPHGKGFVDWRYYYNRRNFYCLEKYHIPLLYQYQRIVDRLDAITHILMNRKPRKYEIILEALRDVEKGKMGRHPIYRPGWKPDFAG